MLPEIRDAKFSNPPEIPFDYNEEYFNILNDGYVKITNNHIIISRKLLPTNGKIKHFMLDVHSVLPDGQKVESVYHFGGERDRKANI